MQPTLIAASAVPGLIYVNGRLIGEVEEGRPQALPVSPFGAVYLEHMPLDVYKRQQAGDVLFFHVFDDPFQTFPVNHDALPFCTV